MQLPKNGIAREIRHYSGSLLIFFFIVGLVIAFIQFPVLESNKEVVMMLVGTLSASIAMVISTITGAKPIEIDSLKNQLEKKELQIDLLVKAKDNLEEMVINMQKQMLENQDAVMDKIILKAAIDYDSKNNPSKK
tara:strand:- start:69 stop:473 length:405 start_codon:yes stop_codon:yes gene_type:complete